MNRKLVITGPAGSGKSTTGRSISQRLQIEHTDIDERLKYDVCSSEIPCLSDYVNQKGFERYLYEEHKKWDQALHSNEGKVISTSGNTLVQGINFGLLQGLREEGADIKVVYLRVSARETVRRILEDSQNFHDRFSEAYYKKAGLEGIMSDIYGKAMRSDSIFMGLADVVIDANKSTIQVTDNILQQVDFSPAISKTS